jgi:hypothetical protein
VDDMCMEAENDKITDLKAWHARSGPKCSAAGSPARTTWLPPQSATICGRDFSAVRLGVRALDSLSLGHA